MAYFDGELDEGLLVEVPCEFCNDPFPLLLLMEHQTGCRPDLARIIEPSIEEVEAEFLNLLEPQKPAEKKEEKIEVSRDNLNSIELAEPPTEPKKSTIGKENTSPEKVSNISQRKGDISVEYNEVLSEDLLTENEKFSFQCTNKEKRVEEEKPSFKFPPNSLINKSDSRHIIHNDLTESDNEEGESLEDFWKKADIKLAQRLKMIEKSKQDRKKYSEGQMYSH